MILKTRRQPPFGLEIHEAYEVMGRVASGFERVRGAFDDNFANGLEVASQLCIYRKGECIVDLCGKISPDSKATPGGQVVNGSALSGSRDLAGLW